MKKKKPDYYSEALVVMQELKTLYPNYSLGRHISTALDDYDDVWGVSDKELSFAFIKYKAQLQLDVPHNEDINEIIRGGMDFSNLISNDEDFPEEQY